MLQRAPAWLTKLQITGGDRSTRPDGAVELLGLDLTSESTGHSPSRHDGALARARIPSSIPEIQQLVIARAISGLRIE